MPNPNAISESLTIVAFMKDGSDAHSARFADYVILHWSYNNLTGSDQKLNFPKGQTFELTLLKPDGAVVWKHPGQVVGADLSVVVISNDSFDLPADNESDETRIPKVPLSDIIGKENIPAADDLVVSLAPLFDGSNSLDRHTRVLWR